MFYCVNLQCNELVAHGASIGKTPAEVINKCEITIAMLSDPAAALSVNTDSFLCMCIQIESQ